MVYCPVLGLLLEWVGCCLLLLFLDKGGDMMLI